jgi:hypothetical protein
MADKDKIQGEGDYASARRYQEDATKAAKAGDIENKARQSEAEKAELERAEEEGKSHAKK